ncbi:MAG: GGDEF domain-containing protein [Candidatus Limnocylindria bacterium]
MGSPLRIFRLRSQRAYAIGIVGALVAWIVEMTVASDQSRGVIANVAWTAVGIGAIIGTARAVRCAERGDRLPWLWILAASGSWTVGQLLRFVGEIAPLWASVPSPADACFLLAAPLYVAGFVGFLARSGRRLAVYALVLDVAAVALTLLAAAALAVGSLFEAGVMLGRPVALIGLLYPTAYVAATAAALSALWGLPAGQARRSHASLALGMALNGAAFTLWLPSYLTGGFRAGTALDPLWVIGMVAVGVAGTQWVEDRATDPPARLPETAIHVARLMLPAVASLVAAVVLVVSHLDGITATDRLVTFLIAAAVILLAVRAGLALFANYRLGELQRRRAAQYEALYTVGLAAAAERSLDELVGLTADHATDLTRCDGARLCLVDDAGRLVVRAQHNPPATFRDALGTISGGIAREAARRRELVVASAYASHMSANPEVFDEIASAMSAPLVAHGELVGTITTYSARPRRFSEETQRLFRLYAAQAATAIAGVRLLEESRRLASDDPLTGVLNRRSLVERLETEVAEARRHGDAVAVVLCDLDGLKQVNDSAGHLVGDEVLHAVAGGLRDCVRTEDSVARFGGDEFVLLLPRTDHAQARSLVGRVAARLGELTYQWGGRELPLPRVSFGIAAFPDDGLTADALIAAADARMYADKSAARPMALLSALDAG